MSVIRKLFGWDGCCLRKRSAPRVYATDLCRAFGARMRIEAFVFTTLATNPKTRGGANHRSILQRVDAELARFALSPNGKPVVTETTEPDEFAEFED